MTETTTPSPTVRHVLFYKPDPDAGPKAGEFFEAHLAHSVAAAQAGGLLHFGPFADLFGQGSMGIFATQTAAEEFVAGDPFVINGVVATHEIREWTDTVG